MANSNFGEEVQTSWSDSELKVYKRGSKYTVFLSIPTEESAKEN